MTTFREYAKEQAQRLGGTVNFPSGADAGVAVRELVDALERSSKGQRTFIERLVGACLETSKFCPTVADVVTVANDLREGDRRKEEATRNQVSEWRKEYGEPKPFSAIKLNEVGGENRRRDEMYRKIKAHLRINDGKWPDWQTMAAAARELGYEDYAKAWEGSVGK